MKASYYTAGCALERFRLGFVSAVAAVGWLMAVVGATEAWAQTKLRENFETADPSWRDAGGDTKYRIEVHQRTSQRPHSGASCEYVEINAGNGTYVHLSHDVGRAPVMAELIPSLWVRADRPGLQLMARAVLPHTTDPRTGRPITRLLVGTSYSQTGRWQRLQIDNVAELLTRQVRVLRAERHLDVDAREAYVDRLILNAFGGAGRTRLWIDELEVAGVVDARRDVAGAVTLTGYFDEHDQRHASRPKIEINGTVLLIDGKAMFPRMIEYQGEPLSFLKARGFNAVRLHKPASPELLAEAARAEMWIVCSPPRPVGLDNDHSAPAELTPFDSRYDPVLAWHMGDGLTARDRARIMKWTEAVRQADGDKVRLVICDADADLKKYSRIADSLSVMMVHSSPLGTGFELTDYADWLRERPNLALGDPTFWTTIQTQMAPELEEQVALLSSGRAPKPVVESEQIRLLVRSAMAAQVRGICFASRTPLDAPDPATRQRALTLESINIELELIQPWLAAGTLSSTAPGMNIDGENPGVNVAILQTERTRLLVPLWSGKSGDQFVPDQLAANDITFVVPGVSEATDAFEITTGGLTPISRQRKRGGLHLKIAEFGMHSLALLTVEPAVGGLTQRLPAVGPRLAAIERELVEYKLDRVSKTDSELAKLGHTVKKSGEWLNGAREHLRSATTSLNSRSFAAAMQDTERAARSLRLLARAHWKDASDELSSPMASPLSANFVTLPQHWLVWAELKAAGRGANQLPGGDMEDFQQMRRDGWEISRYGRQVLMSGEHSPIEPHSGRYNLRLSSSPADPLNPPALVETAPLWVRTPPIPVAAGQWYVIRGCVRVPAPITGSHDGLLIIDSLGGKPLAERIEKTEGWREFTLYRAAPRTGTMTVTIALTGLGEAWIDDMIIEPLVIRLSPRPVQPPVPARAAERRKNPGFSLLGRP